MKTKILDMLNKKESITTYETDIITITLNQEEVDLMNEVLNFQTKNIVKKIAKTKNEEEIIDFIQEYNTFSTVLMSINRPEKTPKLLLNNMLKTDINIALTEYKNHLKSVINVSNDNFDTLCSYIHIINNMLKLLQQHDLIEEKENNIE